MWGAPPLVTTWLLISENWVLLPVTKWFWRWHWIVYWRISPCVCVNHVLVYSLTVNCTTVLTSSSGCSCVWVTTHKGTFCLQLLRYFLKAMVRSRVQYVTILRYCQVLTWWVWGSLLQKVIASVHVQIRTREHSNAKHFVIIPLTATLLAWGIQLLKQSDATSGLRWWFRAEASNLSLGVIHRERITDVSTSEPHSISNCRQLIYMISALFSTE